MRKSHIKTALLFSTALLISCTTSQQQTPSITVQAAQSEHWDVAGTEAKGGKLYNMGRTYLASSKYGLAIDAFRRDIRVNGPNSMSLNGLGITYDMLGRYDLSQKYYQQALELEPDLPITYSNLAYSQYKQGAYENAIHLAEAAKELVSVDDKEKAVSPALKKLAHSNQMLAAETALDEIKKHESEIQNLPEGHVIERQSERDWAMVKPKAKPNSGIGDQYKSNIAIAKILKRKEEIKEIKQKQKQKEKKQSVAEEVVPSVSAQIDNTHEVIELAATLAKLVPETAPTPRNTKNFYVADSDVGFFLVVENADYFKKDAEQAIQVASSIPIPARKPVEAIQLAMAAKSPPAKQTETASSEEGKGFWSSFASIFTDTKRREEEITWHDKPIFTVLNGTGRSKMAKRFSGYINANGMPATKIGDANHYGYEKTVIKFTADHRNHAEALTRVLPVEAELVEVAELSSLVEITLGKDLLDMDDQIHYASTL